jgi:hypothetical protein
MDKFPIKTTRVYSFRINEFLKLFDLPLGTRIDTSGEQGFEAIIETSKKYGKNYFDGELKTEFHMADVQKILDLIPEEKIVRFDYDHSDYPRTTPSDRIRMTTQVKRDEGEIA